MDRFIINCDLGEEEPVEDTDRLMELIDAANIGCGFHAGHPSKTEATIRRAREKKILIGAHPGLPAAGGRGQAIPSPEEFRELLVEQIGSFQDSARTVGARMDYIKLHGTLYHAVENVPALAAVYLDFLTENTPDAGVFTLAQGSFARHAASAGIRIFHEAFFDRAYRNDGSLLPRSEPGAVLDSEAALQRFRLWKEQGTLPTREGGTLQFDADTICVHGDNPKALEMIRSLRRIS